MRFFLLLCLLAGVFVLSSCSFFREFAVVNETNERIQVRYVQTKPNHPEYPSELIEKPKVKLVSELNDRDIDWRLLPETRYTFAYETRTVVLTLEPKEAVRVAVVSNSDCVEDDPGRGGFYIEEINVIGPSGAIRATGEQARSSFVEDKTGKCLLTYR